ncbi:MAG: transglutaminase domain-containing protein [Methanophagales archaeon]|nr:transglutaminase domain-containing protein [Methanophagales archaeon]
MAKKLNILLIFICLFSFAGESLLFFFANDISPMGLSKIEVTDNIAKWNEDYNIDEYLYFDDKELKLIEKEIPQEIKDINDAWVRSIVLCGWIRNLTEPSMEISDMKLGNLPYTMLILMREGKGASCGVYATVYVASAQSIGLPARSVQLVRLGNIYDTHVVAEVWNEEYNKWAVVDPTFNTYYEINGTPASAADIELAFKTANGKNEAEWYNYIKPSDKSRLEEYYLFQYLLYDTIYIFQSTRAKENILEKLPPLRAFKTPNLYFSCDADYPKQQNLVSLLFDIIFPCLFCISAISLICINFRRIKHVWNMRHS